MDNFPNLAGVATAELVEQIGGSFKASYINWSRTLQMLRTHAPGWLPEVVLTADGNLLHRAPVGAYLLICFRYVDGTLTPAVPQAVMDARNAAIHYDKITARDITDTHRRGICLAAALTFGLAYELWAKMPLESGYQQETYSQDTPPEEPVYTGKPMDGVWDGCTAEERQAIEDMCITVGEYADMQDYRGAHEFIAGKSLDHEAKMRLWSLLPSKTRTALKREADES